MTIDKSEKFTWLVRVGYVSRAMLYGVLGLPQNPALDGKLGPVEGALAR